MRKQQQNGGPAFPLSLPVDSECVHRGMTLRDWFAGMALQGLLAGDDERALSMNDAAYNSYLIADCMIEQRRTPTEV